ncbi:MAG: GNAT family N-acetyltransferase [Bacillota bacterium]|nr:GNAT family N-acetyltransferase [Bacillota bacterium]
MKDIISITEEHVLECSGLYVDVFNGEPWNDKWILETAYRRLHDFFMTPNFEGVLYMAGDKVKGAILGNYEHYDNMILYNLKEAFVSSELQGKGIGREMLSELELRVKAQGAARIILLTSKGNKTSEFYLKNGFGEFKDMVFMGKDI